MTPRQTKTLDDSPNADRGARSEDGSLKFPNQINIPEITSLDDQAFTEALASSQPIKVCGLAESWPAVTLWTKENLAERLGSLILPAMEGLSGVFPDPEGRHRSRKIRFGDYVEGLWEGTFKHPMLLDGDSAVIFGSAIHPNENFAPLREDIEVPSCIPPQALHQIGFWLSRHGVSSQLHYDKNMLDNINVQIKGSKEVVLLSPHDASKLYLNTYCDDGANMAQFSKVDLRAPDVEQFPALQDAQAWVGRLEAGDAVLIPSCWFHGFQHVGEININVNYWWRPVAMPWNPITVRKSLWFTIQRALAARDMSDEKISSATRIQALEPEVRAMLEELEADILSSRPRNQHF